METTQKYMTVLWSTMKVEYINMTCVIMFFFLVNVFDRLPSLKRFLNIVIKIAILYIHFVPFAMRLREFCIWAVTWQNQQNGMYAQRRQISLGIRPVWSESSLSSWKKLGSLATQWAHSEDSDQTGRMPTLIWVFAERTVILLVSLRGG